MLFHRRMPHIWAAFSTDLRTWEGTNRHGGIWQLEEAKIGIALTYSIPGDIYSSTTLWIATSFTAWAALLDGRTPQGGAAPAEPILEPEMP